MQSEQLETERKNERYSYFADGRRRVDYVLAYHLIDNDFRDDLDDQRDSCEFSEDDDDIPHTYVICFFIHETKKAFYCFLFVFLTYQ